MAFLDPVLNPLFMPILNSSPFWGIAILALIISLIVTLVYKWVTDQNEMKRLKEEQKSFQARLKDLKGNQEEFMKVQKEAMQVNMQYMKHSFKPTLFTIIPIFLIFGWAIAHLAYEPIYPGEQYSISATFIPGIEGQVELVPPKGTSLINQAVQEINSMEIDKESGTLWRKKNKEKGNTWILKSEQGEHDLLVKVGKESQSKEVIISKELIYTPKISLFDDSSIKDIQINYKKLRPMGEYSIFGWQPGWLGLYIIFSIIFSMVLRKVLKIY